MSLHHFEIHIAQKYGVNVAIFLNNLAYWTEHNIATDTNFNDGTWWSRKTQDAFRILFPYWSRQNIRTIIDKCLSERLIITGNYNKIQYDKTHWYAFTEKGWSLFPRLQAAKNAIGENQPMERRESTNQVAETNQPIQDNAFNNTKDNKSSCDQPPKKQKPKTRKDYNNEQKHHWHAKAKVCEPVTKDAVVCASCGRPENHCQCHSQTLLPKEIRQAFSQAALARLGRATQRQ